MSEFTVIEINGIKMEVDLRHAKKIENYKIGDNIKVLIKGYGDSYTTYPGVIVGFDQFDQLPTINICYVQLEYSSAEVKFISINSKSKDIEIVHMAEHEKVIDRSRALQILDDKVNKAKAEMDDLIRKRNYFIEKYNQHFEVANDTSV